MEGQGCAWILGFLESVRCGSVRDAGRGACFHLCCFFCTFPVGLLGEGCQENLLPVPCQPVHSNYSCWKPNARRHGLGHRECLALVGRDHCAASWMKGVFFFITKIRQAVKDFFSTKEEGVILLKWFRQTLFSWKAMSVFMDHCLQAELLSETFGKMEKRPRGTEGSLWPSTTASLEP